MKFSLAKGPFLRNKRSTTGIMLELFAVLAVVWLVSVVSYRPVKMRSRTMNPWINSPFKWALWP